MNLILYDGICKLCDGLVNYIIDHDSNNSFKFAQLQSEFAKQLLKKYGYDSKDLNTFYLITDYSTPKEKIYLKSTAGLITFQKLGGVTGVFAKMGLIFPTFLRDPFYNLIAATRYKIFGKYSSCKIPTPAILEKFIS
jgi:predicted DCC family thiol-disulfide oxidoreductase YuxK